MPRRRLFGSLGAKRRLSSGRARRGGGRSTLRHGSRDEPGGFQSIHIWHRVIEQYDVRLQLSREFNAILPVFSLTAYVMALIHLKANAKSVSNVRVIVDNQNSRHGCRSKRTLKLLHFRKVTVTNTIGHIPTCVVIAGTVVE
jgi:hypothetical protein